MFRTASRLIARPAAVRAALPRSIAPARRHLSTAPPTQKSRSWKSLVARLGIAGTIIYYYNTTDVFAEEPRHPVQALPETEVESEHLPTIESISAERQKRKAVQAQLDAQAQQETQSAQQNAAPAGGAQGGIEGLEEEADQQGAFNPETGEINWDCPCLGGMAHGPCGEQFRAAFSCFVYSSEEPKGMDCIDRFKDMQNCFRQYPEVYGSELESDAVDDEDDLTADAATPAHASSDPASKPSSSASTQIPSAATSTTSATSATSASASTSEPQSSTPEAGRIEKGKQSAEHSSKPPSPEKATESRPGLGLVPDNYKPDAKTETGQANQASSQVTSQEPVNESESLVPKAAFDAGDGNTEVLERK